MMFLREFYDKERRLNSKNRWVWIVTFFIFNYVAYMYFFQPDAFMNESSQSTKMWIPMDLILTVTIVCYQMFYNIIQGFEDEIHSIIEKTKCAIASKLHKVLVRKKTDEEWKNTFQCPVAFFDKNKYHDVEEFKYSFGKCMVVDSFKSAMIRQPLLDKDDVGHECKLTSKDVTLCDEHGVHKTYGKKNINGALY